jgi:hypothetical protein
MPYMVINLSVLWIEIFKYFDEFISFTYWFIHYIVFLFV